MFCMALRLARVARAPALGKCPARRTNLSDDNFSDITCNLLTLVAHLDTALAVSRKEIMPEIEEVSKEEADDPDDPETSKDKKWKGREDRMMAAVRKKYADHSKEEL